MSHATDEASKLADPSEGPFEFVRFCQHDGRPIQTVADVTETMAMSAEKSTRAELFGVCIKERDEQGKQRVVCYTGNGPRSEANARLIAELLSGHRTTAAPPAPFGSTKQLTEHDHVCEHGTALDVHCCNCHSGFIFEKHHQCPAPTPAKETAMITIRPSSTADTRTCDFANVSKETLLASSHQHIGDVRQALAYFVALISFAAKDHDTDKITNIDGFHADFVTGFKATGWWDLHRKLNRHHLTHPSGDGIPKDVNLIDVLDFIADCVMAGMARSGSVTPLTLAPELLERAFQNTVALLKANVRVEP